MLSIQSSFLSLEFLSNISKKIKIRKKDVSFGYSLDLKDAIHTHDQRSSGVTFRKDHRTRKSV